MKDKHPETQRIKTGRYVELRIKGFAFWKDEPVHLAWFSRGNGLPLKGYVLVADPPTNAIFSFKDSQQGWRAFITDECTEEHEFTIVSEVRLKKLDMSQKQELLYLKFNVVKNDGTVNGPIATQPVGSVTIALTLMSTKCTSTAIFGEFTPIMVGNKS